MQTFGVVGAGTMGSGIAQKIAIEGCPVTIVDLNQEALDRGRKSMEQIFAESVKRRILREDKAEAILNSVTFTTDYAALADTDLVVEAVFEDKAVKANVFEKIAAAAGSGTVIASNTSSFPITELAKAVSGPERFVGLHYFYHPVKNRLLEVIPGAQTSAQTMGKARSFCSLQGKVEILCSDSPGFVVNRFFVPWLNEAVRLLEEGLASLATIEATCKKGFRLGMGPFELMNVTGVPIAAHAADGLAEYLGEFYRPDQKLVTQTGIGSWEIGDSDEFSDEVFQRMLGLSWAVASTLVDEGTCTELDVDLGAQVGLRWPAGPFTLFNKLDPTVRGLAIESFKSRHAEFPLPSSLGPDVTYSIPTVVSETAEAIATVALARPDKSNALNGQVFRELDSAVSQVVDKPVMVLKGMGKNFAAGADIRFFIKNIEAGQIDNIVSFTAGAQTVLKNIEDFPGKVVAAIDGFALGGGAELMLAADVIVATPRALIGFPETGIGIFPGLGGGYRLANRIGKDLATYLITTGQMLDGNTARSMGVVDHCLSPLEMTPLNLAALEPQDKPDPGPKWEAIHGLFAENDLDSLLNSEFAEEWQQKIQKKLKSKAPIALRMSVDLINSAASRTIDEEYSAELALLPEVFNSEDAMTGLKSIGKYRPEFTGK